MRIIAATNRTVAGPGQGASGLRDDIVARLGAAPIHLPPLRNRIEDLGALVGAFPAGHARRVTLRAAGVPRAGAARLAAERARAGEDRHHRRRADGRRKPIALRDLPEPIARALCGARRSGRAPADRPSPTPAQIEELLRRYDGNVADVSRELGKHRAAVWRWMKKFGLGPHKFRRTE